MSESFGKLFRGPVMDGTLRAIKRSPGAILVWIAYVSHANQSGKSYIATESLSRAFALDPDTVRRARRMLEQQGLLIDTGLRRHRCKVYEIGPKPRASAGCDAEATPHVRRCNPVSAPVKPRAGAGQTDQNKKKTEVKNNPATPFPENSDAEAGYLRLMAATADPIGEVS